MATFEDIIKQQEEEEEEGRLSDLFGDDGTSKEELLDELFPQEESVSFDYKDYIHASKDVNAGDYLVASNYRPIDTSSSNAQISSNLGQSFLHGLSLHHTGEAPETFMSMDGLSYLLGTMVPIVAFNRTGAHFAKGMVGRLGFADDALRIGKDGKVIHASGNTASKLKPGQSAPFAFGNKGEVVRDVATNPFMSRVAQAKAMRNTEAMEHGMRIAMEAGLWNLGDAHFNGLSGYRDALLYTILGEGIALGVGRAINRMKNPENLTKGAAGSKGNVAVKETIDLTEDTVNIGNVAKEAGEGLDETTVIGRDKLSPKEEQQLGIIMTKVRAKIQEIKDLRTNADATTEGLIETVLENKPEFLKNIILKKTTKDGDVGYRLKPEQEAIESFEIAVKKSQQDYMIGRTRAEARAKKMLPKIEKEIEEIRLGNKEIIEDRLRKTKVNYKQYIKNKEGKEVTQAETSFTNQEIAEAAAMKDKMELITDVAGVLEGTKNVKIGNPYFDSAPRYVGVEREIKGNPIISSRVAPENIKSKAEFEQVYGASKTNTRKARLDQIEKRSLQNPTFVARFYTGYPKKGIASFNRYIGEQFEKIAPYIKTSDVFPITGSFKGKEFLDQFPGSRQQPTTVYEFNNIRFNQVDTRRSYKNRTEYNVKNSNVTIDFTRTKQGSGSTKEAAKANRKRYRQVQVDNSGRILPAKKEDLINFMTKELEKGNTINMAGHGAYKSFRAGFKTKVSQEVIDKELLAIFKEVNNRLAGKKVSGKIISGGQTGFDEAAIKAANTYKFDVEVNYSGEGLFRPSTGMGARDDVNDIVQFIRRFEPVQGKPGVSSPKIVEKEITEQTITPVEMSLDDLTLTGGRPPAMGVLDEYGAISFIQAVAQVSPVAARRLTLLYNYLGPVKGNNLIEGVASKMGKRKSKGADALTDLLKSKKQIKQPDDMIGPPPFTFNKPPASISGNEQALKNYANAEFTEHIKQVNKELDEFRRTFSDDEILKAVTAIEKDIARLEKRPLKTKAQLEAQARVLKQELYAIEYTARVETDRYQMMFNKDGLPYDYAGKVEQIGPAKADIDFLADDTATLKMDDELIEQTATREFNPMADDFNKPDNLEQITTLYDVLLTESKQFGPVKVDFVEGPLPPTKEAGVPLVKRLDNSIKMSKLDHQVIDNLEYNLNVKYAKDAYFNNIDEARNFHYNLIKNNFPTVKVVKDGTSLRITGGRTISIEEIPNDVFLSQPGMPKYVALPNGKSVDDYVQYVTDTQIRKIRQADKSIAKKTPNQSINKGSNVKNISAPKGLNRASGGKEVDNLTYLEGVLDRALGGNKSVAPVVDVDTWLKGSPEFQRKHIPLSKLYVHELLDTIRQSVETYSTGNLRMTDLKEMAENVLRKRKIDINKLPENVPYNKISQRRVDDFKIALEKAGEANKHGVNAANYKEILDSKKVMKTIYENFDELTSKNSKAQDKLMDDLRKTIEELENNGFVTSGQMKLQDLKDIADFIKYDTGLSSQTRMNKFVKNIEDSFAKEVLDESSLKYRTKFEKEQTYGTLDKRYQTDKHHGPSNMQKEMDTQLSYDWTPTLTKLQQHIKLFEGNPPTMEGIISVIRTNPTMKEYVRAHLADYIRRNPELMDNVSIGQGLRTAELPSPSPGIRTGGAEGLKFKDRWSRIGKDVAAGRLTPQQQRLEMNAVVKDWLAVMTDNPHIYNTWLDSHAMRGSSFDQFYHLARYGYGDDQAKHILLDTRNNQYFANTTHIVNSKLTQEYPTPVFKNMDDGVIIGRKEKGLGTSIDEVGTSGTNGGLPPDDIGGALTDTPAPQMTINNLAKELVQDPIKIFKKAYNIIGDFEFIKLGNIARDYVNRMGRIGREYEEWVAASEVNEVLRKMRENFKPSTLYKTFDDKEKGLINKLNKVNRDFEEKRILTDRPALKKKEEKLRKQKVSEEDIQSALNSEKMLLRQKELTELETMLLKEFDIEEQAAARAFYAAFKDMKEIRYNKFITPQLNAELVKAGIEPMTKVGDLVGYFPMISDGAFQVQLQKGSRWVTVGTSAISDKQAVTKQLQTWVQNKSNQRLLGNEGNLNGWYIHIRPVNRDLSMVKDIKLANTIDQNMKYRLGDAYKVLSGETKLNPGDNVVDYLFRNGTMRGEGGIALTPYKTLDEMMRSYWYNASKSANVLEITSKIRQLQAKYPITQQPDLHKYLGDYLDALTGKKTPIEKGLDKVISGGMDLLYKIPVVREGLEKLGFKEGSANVRALSNVIQRTSSFVALGANIATALLQFTIVGLNVLPRIAWNPNGGRILQKAWANAGKIANESSIYNKAFKKAELEVWKQDGAVQDILNQGGIQKGGRTREAFSRINNYAMWMFQTSDTRSRMFSIVAGYEHGKVVMQALRKKLNNPKIPQLNRSNYLKYLDQDERMMWLRTQEKKLDIGSLKVTDDASKDLLTDFSVDFMENTNHTYNSFNNPLAFSNPVTKPFLQFKTWVQKEITFFFDAFREVPSYEGLSMAQRYANAAKMTAAFTAMGGIFSLPGAQELDMAARWAFGVSPKAWFYEQDSPLHDIISGGLFTAAGLSMEGRTGPGNFFTVVDTDNLFGIYPARLIKAAGAYRSGEIDRAWNFALPRFVQNMKQGYDMITTGQLRNTYNGGLMFELDDMRGNEMVNIMYKLAGFQPMDEARYQAIKFATLDMSAKRGRDRKHATHSILELLEDGEIQKAYELSKEAEIPWSNIKQLLKRKNTEDYKNSSMPYVGEQELETDIYNSFYKKDKRR